MNRRTALIAGSAAAVGIVDAFALEPNWLEVTQHDVAVSGLPTSLEGYSIAQITDAHLTAIGTTEESILSSIQRVRPQAVVLTGDIVDSTKHLDLLQSLCAELSKMGTQLIATLGNWEHWGEVNLTDLALKYGKVGARLLVNETARLDGVSYQGTDDFLGGTPKVSQEGKAHASVLLTHSPAFLDEVPSLNRPFDLALSGHTHGGQIRLTSRGVPFLPPGSGRFTSGWYETPCGQAYVSRGTGTSLVPARFTCRPELPLFSFRRA